MGIAILFVVLGIAGRSILPALVEWKNNPNLVIDKQFILPPLLSIVICAILIPFVGDKIDVTLPWYALFAIGWSISDLVRTIQKTLV